MTRTRYDFNNYNMYSYCGIVVSNIFLTLYICVVQQTSKRVFIIFNLTYIVIEVRIKGERHWHRHDAHPQ